MPLANRLWVHEIDEVSSVDRDANGHARVLITKRDPGEDTPMGLYDADGNEVAEDQMVPGAFYYDSPDEDAREFRFLDDDALEALTDEEYNELDIPDDLSGLEGEDAESGLELVGKAFGGAAITGAASTIRRTGRGMADSALGHGGDGLGPSSGARGAARRGAMRGAMKGRAAISRRPIAAVAGGAAAGYGAGKFGKSMGDEVLETLSKALGDSERDQVISKAFTTLSKRLAAAEQRAIASERVAKSLEDQQVLSQYIQLADEYDLPVDSTEFGEILAGIGTAGFSKRQLQVLDGVFSAAGMNGSPLFNEIGAVGATMPTNVMDQVNAAVRENITKADVTPEQMAAAVFEANPELYAAYEAEQRAGLHR